MEKLYSIGETAKTMGISVQTLRNYSRLPFLKPAYVNETTGYRYYSFEQFHIIDRIKYLRSFNLSLAEIQEIMIDGKRVDKIVAFLENRERNMDREIENLLAQKADLRWYIDYFKYADELKNSDIVHIRRFDRRRVLFVECSKGESVEEIEVRLAKLKSVYAQYGMTFRRQFGYLLDFGDVMRQEWNPKGYFIYASNGSAEIEGYPLPEQRCFKEFSEGDYLCISFRIYHMEELNVRLLSKYFEKEKRPAWALANEHEDNLVSYKNCPYELQILLEEKN